MNYLPEAGFEPWSFWSLPPEYLGLQVWATGAQQAGIIIVPFYCPHVDREGL
jgi:hypothetical protein